MEKLTSKTVTNVTKKIASDYPDFSDITPKVVSIGKDRFELTYEQKRKTADGETLKLVLKTIVDQDGEIIRVSTTK